MTTRQHIHEEAFDLAPERVFQALHTPADIRGWWGAARAIVVARRGGVWAAAWGDSENDPDYVTVARITAFEPPHRLRLEDYRYWAKAGSASPEAVFVTEFVVTATPGGATLRVSQDGFPAGPEGDDFLAGCEVGWRETFAGLRRYLGAGSPRLSGA